MSQDLLLILLRILFMILFFIIVVVVGTLPIRSAKFKKNPFLMSMGATFAGCLFINVALMHILPEAADSLEEYMKSDTSDSDEVFPLAYLLLMVGFIITVFFTKVMSFHSHGESDSQHEHEHSHDHLDSQHNHGKGTNKESLLSKEESKNQNYQNQQRNSDSKTKIKTQTNDISVNSHEHSHDLAQNNKSVLSSAFVLTLAIYFHTIFEGIAIGVQDSLTKFLGTAIAIALHKWADALSMGIHYKSKNISRKISYSLILGQAILNVVAIGIGWIISQSGPVIQAVFLSISSGTFLAISTLELLGEQFHSRTYIYIKFLLLIGATGFVACIWFFENSIFNEE